MRSVWSMETELPERKPLEGDREAEAVVIGAGMAGVLTAYFLQKRGKNVVVLEADRIAGGQTKGTTAKITSQHAMIYDNLIQKIGRAKARLYAGANENAILEYRRIIEEENIECDFNMLASNLYSRVDEEQLKREADAAAQLGIPACFTKESELPFEVAGLVCFENQAEFQPLEFIRQITKNLDIYEKTRAVSVKGHTIETNRGKVEAEHIVFATHYPFINVPGFYFLRQHQERSYVLALSGVKPLHSMYYGVDQGDFSFRSHNDIVLFGGGAHRTGEKCCEDVYETLTEQARQYFPSCQIEAGWSAQDCMPHDNIPFVGRYSVFRPYWYVASGFKKWGMTSSMIAAKIITEQICGEENPYEKVFCPQRIYVKSSAVNFLKDVGVSAKGLLAGCFHSNTRCPHMGCHLVWNPNEKSWDCPCHGSRFEKDGILIDNPAQNNMKKCPD